MSAVAWESGVGRLGTGPIVPLAALVLREHAAGLGWSGWGRVRQADRASTAALFARAQEHGLVPGSPVILSLSPAGEGPVRSWPSILTDLEVRSGTDTAPTVFVRVADPLTHLGTRPLFGVFSALSPARIVVECLARAAGAGAAAGSLQFSHPSFPTVRARERVGEDLEDVPCAIASGEPLLDFIRRFLDGIGARIVVQGLASGEIELDLTDRGEERTRGTTGAVRLCASFEARLGRGTLSVRRLIVERAPGRGSQSAAEASTTNEAAGGPQGPSGPPSGEDGRQERLGGPGANGSVSRAFALSEAPGIRGGGRIELTHEAVAGTREWRVLATTHRLADRGYRNESFLEQYDSSPRADRLAGWPSPRTLTGVVDEDGLEEGAPVPVDARGRIPVRLSCDARTAVRLPFILPSAGAVHGFAPACCRGDRVRVRVHGPLRAEIEGARWSEARAPDEVARGSAQAMQADTGLGVAFHPAERIAEIVG